MAAVMVIPTSVFPSNNIASAFIRTATIPISGEINSGFPEPFLVKFVKRFRSKTAIAVRDCFVAQ